MMKEWNVKYEMEDERREKVIQGGNVKSHALYTVEVKWSGTSLKLKVQLQ